MWEEGQMALPLCQAAKKQTFELLHEWVKSHANEDNALHAFPETCTQFHLRYLAHAYFNHVLKQ